MQSEIDKENEKLEKKKNDNEKRLRILDLNEAKYKRVEQNNKHAIKVQEEEYAKQQKEKEAKQKLADKKENRSRPIMHDDLISKAKKANMNAKKNAIPKILGNNTIREDMVAEDDVSEQDIMIAPATTNGDMSP